MKNAVRIHLDTSRGLKKRKNKKKSDFGGLGDFGRKFYIRASETEPIQFDYNQNAFTVGAKVSQIDLSAAVWFLMGRCLVSARLDQPGLARLGPIHRSEG